MKYLIIFLAFAGLILASVAWQFVGWRFSDPGQHVERGVYYLASGLAILVLLLFFGGTFTASGRELPHKNWTRSRLMIAAILLCGNVKLTYDYPKQRIAMTKQTLEDTYKRLSLQIGQFPKHTLGPAFDGWNNPDLLSHGYWRSEDGQRFEIFYHVRSDSYVMRFPEGKWQWCGFGYNGEGNSRKSPRR